MHGSFNAVFVKAEAADDLMFYGRGAGGAPTASAVVGDVVTEARHIAAGCTGPSIPLYKNLPKAPITASKAAFAVRFLIHDKPGVLAAIAAEDKDYASSNKLVWFVDEQVEEEESAREMITACEAVEGNKFGLYMLDKELAARTYTQASPLATANA